MTRTYAPWGLMALRPHSGVDASGLNRSAYLVAGVAGELAPRPVLGLRG